MSSDLEPYQHGDFLVDVGGKLVYSGPIYHVVYPQGVGINLTAELLDFWGFGLITRMDRDIDMECTFSVYAEVPDWMRRRAAQKGAFIDLVKERGEPVYFPSH